MAADAAPDHDTIFALPCGGSRARSSRAFASSPRASSTSKRPHAERAWDCYPQTGTFTRDLAFSEPGLRKVFDAQIKAGLLPASRTFDAARYVAGGYLGRARATVVKD